MQYFDKNILVYYGQFTQRFEDYKNEIRVFYGIHLLLMYRKANYSIHFSQFKFVTFQMLKFQQICKKISYICFRNRKCKFTEICSRLWNRINAMFFEYKNVKKIDFSTQFSLYRLTHYFLHINYIVCRKINEYR